MSNIDINSKIDNIENLMERAFNELAVLKRGLAGSGNPKAPNRKSNAVAQALNKRARSRTKKSHQ